MVPFLSQNLAVQIIRLNNNGLGPAGGTVIANALLESAQRSKKAGTPSNLRTLICGRNRLEDGSAPAWAAAIAEHGGLVEVRLPQNGIRMAGAAALAHGLAACKGLRHLDMQDNTFGEEGAVAMTQALRAWPDLHTLNLSDCVIGEEGAVSPVVEALAAGSNPKLELLLLQNNNLEAQSFALLAEGIEVHLPVLTRLEIQWNEVEEEDEGIQALTGALQQRGGKLMLDDEDEEEEEQEEEEEEEEAKTDEKAEKEPEADSAADDLADLLNKVQIR